MLQIKLCRYLTGQGHSPFLNFVNRYNESLLYPAHNFILHGGFQNYMQRRSVEYKDHVAKLKVKVTLQT